MKSLIELINSLLITADPSCKFYGLVVETVQDGKGVFVRAEDAIATQAYMIEGNSVVEAKRVGAMKTTMSITIPIKTKDRSTYEHFVNRLRKIDTVLKVSATGPSINNAIKYFGLPKERVRPPFEYRLIDISVVIVE